MARTPRVPCPDCGSPQVFAPRGRTEGDVAVVYIQCPRCRYRRDLYTTTEEIERLRRKLSRVRSAKIRRRANGGLDSYRRDAEERRISSEIARLAEESGTNPPV